MVPTSKKAHVDEWSIIGGTRVPGTIHLMIPAMRASAIAGHIELQGTQNPSVSPYPQTTVGTHLVNHHLFLSHLGSHVKIRMR